MEAATGERDRNSCSRSTPDVQVGVNGNGCSIIVRECLGAPERYHGERDRYERDEEALERASRPPPFGKGVAGVAESERGREGDKVVNGKEESLLLVRAAEKEEEPEEEGENSREAHVLAYVRLLGGGAGHDPEDVCEGVDGREESDAVEVQDEVLKVVRERFDAVQLVTRRRSRLVSGASHRVVDENVQIGHGELAVKIEVEEDADRGKESEGENSEEEGH